jgi:hypothetical protein
VTLWPGRWVATNRGILFEQSYARKEVDEVCSV